jgi:hypothetical protein
MFDMASDSGRFFTAGNLMEDGWVLDGNVFVRGNERALPLYEGKHAHLFDSRFATYEHATQAQINKGTLPQLDLIEHAEPSKLPLPRYWVHESLVDEKYSAESGDLDVEWPHDWVMGWRDVCRSSDVRTVIATVLPRTAVGHKFPLMNSPRTG